jgi:hypothetical protein
MEKTPLAGMNFSLIFSQSGLPGSGFSGNGKNNFFSLFQKKKLSTKILTILSQGVD